MNAFYEHHKSSIEFAYRCFDRILLNGLIQPFQQPERVLGFFNTYRDGKRVTRNALTEIADQFHHWVTNRAEKWGAQIVEAPQEQRRDDFVLPYLQKTEADHVAVILKAREPARILVAIGGKQNQCPHLELKQRWVNQYNFYLNDQHWGPMFVRMCPYFPFSARVCLNQHHWLALRMQQQGITFRQCKNAFLRCSDPERLQQLADSLTAQDLLRCGQKWVAAFTPFFSSQERRQAGCQHRLFFSQVELCDNLIFFRRAAVDQFAERLLDMNRTIGQPKKITLIFGNTRASCRPNSKTSIFPIPSFAVTTPMDSPSNTSAMTAYYEPSRPPMTSPTMGSKRTSRICRCCASACPRSLTTTTMPSKTSWKLSSIAANSKNWLSPPP